MWINLPYPFTNIEILSEKPIANSEVEHLLKEYADNTLTASRHPLIYKSALCSAAYEKSMDMQSGRGSDLIFYLSTLQSSWLSNCIEKNSAKRYLDGNLKWNIQLNLNLKWTLVNGLSLNKAFDVSLVITVTGN